MRTASGKKSRGSSTKKSMKKRNFAMDDEEHKNDLDLVEEGSDDARPTKDGKSSKTLLKDSKKKSNSAWVDEDDQELEVDLTKVSRLRKLIKVGEEGIVTGKQYEEKLTEYYNSKTNRNEFYKWTKKSNLPSSALEEEGELEIDNLLRSTNNIVKGVDSVGDSLPQGTIDLARIAMTRFEDKHEAVVQTIDFFKDKDLFLTAGLDKTIKLFQISKQAETSKYFLKPTKSYYLKGLPIQKAQFLNSENQIIASGMSKYFVTLDLGSERLERISPSFVTSRLDGKIKGLVISPSEDVFALWGESCYISIMCAKTKQLLYELKVNNPISTVTFSTDSTHLFCACQDGSIYQWDLIKRAIFDSFHDQGSTKTVCIDVSRNFDYLATGSTSGIVNLYDINRKTKQVDQKNPKEVNNLTTYIDNVKFNPATEILALSSKWKKSSIRLLHIGSKTVFSNWPNLRTKLSFATALGFSSDNRYFAIGNDEGNVHCYSVGHYMQA